MMNLPKNFAEVSARIEERLKQSGIAPADRIPYLKALLAPHCGGSEIAALVMMAESPERVLGLLIEAEQKRDGGQPAMDDRWCRVAEAETIYGIDRGQISRAADNEEIKSNGNTGTERRLDRVSLRAWARIKRPELAD